MDCATKSGGSDGVPAVFTVDWQAVELWLKLHPIVDGADVFETIVALVKNLNA